MAIKFTKYSGQNNVTGSIDTLISKRSQAIVDEYAEQYQEDLNDAMKEWQQTVRDKLSEPVQRSGGFYIRNTSLWPRMQQRRLVRAIEQPSVRKSIRQGLTSDRKNQIRFTISNFYGPRVESIGVYLDQMKEPGTGRLKPFAGWLTRANDIWRDLIKLRLRNG